MKFTLLTIVTFLACTSGVIAQYLPGEIRSEFVLERRRVNFDKTLRERTIAGSFAQPLDSNSEDNYREACWAIAQFLIRYEMIERGFRNLFNGYDALELSTKRAFLEAVYAVYPTQYVADMRRLLQKEVDPRSFAIQSVYLYRVDSSKGNVERILTLLRQRFPLYPTMPVLAELERYLLNHATMRKQPTPDIKLLVEHNRLAGRKVVYSFQRWNRDWPGLAIIQYENGEFARDSSGKLQVFRQLARSGSDLPYFITNGSTPQGIYSIQGTAVSRNHLIGPTPNLQLVMPGEADSIFWHSGYDSAQSALVNYRNLLPERWQSYSPMFEAFAAGNIGRTEIIAHGTTIDPAYFKDKPYYPLTPTMGCLCAPETWDPVTGKIRQSDQLALVNAFFITPQTRGYLFVINLDDKEGEVTEEEVSRWLMAVGF